MSSTPIYTHSAGDRTPYTYYIAWSYLGVHYYGRRTAKGCHPSELWVDYFTSSAIVEETRLMCEPDIIEVRCVFDSIESCMMCEHRILSYVNASSTEKWLNRNNANGSFDGTFNKGKTAAWDKNGKSLGHVEISDNRWATGEITGKRHTSCSKEKLRQQNIGKSNAVLVTTGESIGSVSVDDPRWLTGEIVGSHKNKTFDSSKYESRRNASPAKCSVTGEKLGKISLLDHRWKTGEIVSTSCGLKQSEETIKKRYATQMKKGYLNKSSSGKKTVSNLKLKLRCVIPEEHLSKFIELGWINKKDMSCELISFTHISQMFQMGLQ